MKDGRAAYVLWPRYLLFDLVLSPPGPHSAHIHRHLTYRQVFNVCNCPWSAFLS